MADPLDRLRLIQWLSPAFPVGGFAYSAGLEQAISAGQVTTPDDVAAWLHDLLFHGSGRMDAVFLAQARAPGADVEFLADLARAYAASAERLLEITEQGRAFGLTLGTMIGADLPPLPYAVAVGHATAPLDLTDAEVIEVWLMSLAQQILQAAVRFLPMGQTRAQTILADLLPDLRALAQAAATTPLDAIATATLGADLIQMQHETLETRIFRT